MVFPFENRSGDKKAEWLGYGMEILLEDSLQGIPLAARMEAVDSVDVPDSPNLTLATRLIIARKLGANVLITGNYTVSKGSISIEFTRYEINKLLRNSGECSVKMAGFPGTLAPFIREKAGGDYPYPQHFTGHQFEVYVRGMLRAIVNSDFEEISDLAGKVTDCEPLNRNLGNLLYDTGHFETALPLLKRLPETDRDGRFRSGMCCVQLENYADGLIFFLQALKTGRNAASLVNAAGCLLALHHPVEAETFLDSFPEKGQNPDPTVLFDRAVVSASQGKWTEALDKLSHYISSYRNTDEAGAFAAFCCKNSDGSHPLCSDETGKADKSAKKQTVISFYQFSDGQKVGNSALDLQEIKELYLKKAAQALKSGSKEEAVDALRKVLYLDPLQKDALKILCSQCNDEKACKKLEKLQHGGAAAQRRMLDVRF